MLLDFRGLDGVQNGIFQTLNWELKKQGREKQINKIFAGLSRDFFWGGDFVYVLFSPKRNDPRKTHQQNVATHPVPGQSRIFIYVYVFFFP